MKNEPYSSTPWLYKGKPFLVAPADAVGFVYLITNPASGRQYVGKKHFWFNRKTKRGGRVRRITKESDWQRYCSSCLEIKAAAKAGTCFIREILTLCNSKSELSYCEVEQQIKRDVLTAPLPNSDGSPSDQYRYYNANILNRFFRTK